MIAKVLILALALSANAQLITKSVYGTGLGHSVYGAGLGLTGGVPVYSSSANYGGLLAANGWGYGANLGRVAGLGALRTTGAIIGGGALGYGSGALIAGGVPAYKTLAVGGVAPAISTVGLGYGAVAPAISTVGLGGLAINQGAYGLGNLNVARGLSVHQAGPVNAAVHTLSRTVDYRAVPYTGEAPTVQDIDVPPQESPLRINFQSKSSPLAVTQQHIPAEPGQTQVTQSEDEPQTAIHNVHRPVVQQVNEVVQPYRTLTQTVEPVIEQAHTNIAQGEGVRLTGLTSGVVGGSGVIAASGLGVAAPAVAVGGLRVANAGLGLAGYGSGLGLAGYGAGLGYGIRSAAIAPAGVVGIGGLRTLGLANSGLYGTRVLNSGLVGSGLVGSGLVSNGYYGSGLIGNGVYGAGLYGAGLRGVGLSSGYGLGLNGLSGLSTYGTTAKIARFAY